MTDSASEEVVVENNFLAVPAPVPPPVAVPNTSINGTGGNEAWDADDGSDPNKSREENARQPNVAQDLGLQADMGRKMKKMRGIMSQRSRVKLISILPRIAIQNSMINTVNCRIKI